MTCQRHVPSRMSLDLHDQERVKIDASQEKRIAWIRSQCFVNKLLTSETQLLPSTYGIRHSKCASLSGNVFGSFPRDSRGFGAGMKLSAKYTSSRRDLPKGFSLVELLLSLAVLLVLTAVAIPVVVRSLQSYQLNSVASQFAGMLKFTKFEAIRQNTLVGCQIVRQGSNWFVWVDSNGNGIADGAEPQMVITGSLTLLPEASVPSPAPIVASLGPGRSSFLYVVWSGVNASVIYDQRGVLYYPGGVTEAYAYYLGNRNDPNFGYRAIIVLPSGAVQVWTSSSAGDWQRVS